MLALEINIVVHISQQNYNIHLEDYTGNRILQKISVKNWMFVPGCSTVYNKSYELVKALHTPVFDHLLIWPRASIYVFKTMTSFSKIKWRSFHILKQTSPSFTPEYASISSGSSAYINHEVSAKRSLHDGLLVQFAAIYTRLNIIILQFCVPVRWIGCTSTNAYFWHLLSTNSSANISTAYITCANAIHPGCMWPPNPLGKPNKEENACGLVSVISW